MTVSDHAPCQLDVSGLGCIRSGKVLFRHLDLQLQSGQMLVVQGGNGVGKSTLLRTLAGLLPWRAGQMRWCGQPSAARDAAYQQSLVYLGHQTGMHDALSPLENLDFSLRLMGCPSERAQTLQVLADLGLAAVADRPMAQLSQGQRRRTGLARVWLSRRPLWLLDEPDNALDAQGAEWLAQALGLHMAGNGMAVVVSHRGLAMPSTAYRSVQLPPPAAAPEHAPAGPLQEARAC